MKLTLFILVSIFSTAISAGVFKCTDANGKTDYQATPCNTEHENLELNLKTGSSVNLNEKQKQAVLEQELEEKKQALQELEKKQQALTQTELQKNAAAESEKNQTLIKNNPQQYSAFAIPPYTFDSLPELVKDYQARLPEIERFRRTAAQKALATGECIRVEAVELNIKTTKNALVFLVDCSSAKKFYFSELDLH